MTVVAEQDTTQTHDHENSGVHLNNRNENSNANGNESLQQEPPRKRTPLPKFQLFIVLLIQFAEPITATVIYPFINQFVRDTGVTKGDERRTGYYAGIIESTFFITEGLTVVYWGRASDYFGRRPILLLGPLGLALAMLSFGLSTDFLSMVVSRCMQGAFNGNIGVSKTVMGEITDSTNVADAFAMIPLMWTTGTTIAPIIGGLLSQPATRWPDLFGKIPFFQQYPYLLPCAVAALISVLTAVCGFMGLKETLPSAVLREKKKKAAIERCAATDATTPLLCGHNEQGYSTTATNSTIESAETEDEENMAPPSIRDILTPQITLILVIYAFMTFTDISLGVLQPLVYSTSVSLGGLGFDPYRIGAVMGTWGFVNTIFNLFGLPRFLRKFGARKVQNLVYCSYTIELMLYPVMRYLVKRAGGVDGFVWTVLIVQLTLALCHGAAFASIYMLILDVTPNRAALGTTNGMTQAVGSVTRAIGPTVASSLFSISLERRLAGGNMVFMVLFVIAAIGLRLTFLLPKRTTTK
ncbi:hypothetical protein H0H93_006896 [Arthromyces matolae]|nr:hypothetical protein H0H93_006896 [Arthromyces matolae]